MRFKSVTSDLIQSNFANFMPKFQTKIICLGLGPITCETRFCGIWCKSVHAPNIRCRWRINVSDEWDIEAVACKIGEGGQQQ